MTPTSERWRSMMMFDYEVSDRGRVRRLGGRVLKPKIDRDGYRIVRLSRYGKARDFKVHRLVCLMFNGPPPDARSLCRHRDGDPANNTPRNLMWGTQKQNAADRAWHGSTLRGGRSPRAKFSDAQVKQIRRRHALAQRGRQRVRRGFLVELAREFEVSRNTINAIVGGRGYGGKENTQHRL